MAKKDSYSLHTLPVEIVYNILDQMDKSTILLSLRNVCLRLNTIIDTYQPYQSFNTTELSYDRFSDEKLQHLADVIMTNTVRQKYSCCLFYIFILQTLTALTLLTTETGDRGMQFISKAIQNNKVNIAPYLSIFINFYRH